MCAIRHIQNCEYGHQNGSFCIDYSSDYLVLNKTRYLIITNIAFFNLQTVHAHPRGTGGGEAG